MEKKIAKVEKSQVFQLQSFVHSLQGLPQSFLEVFKPSTPSFICSFSQLLCENSNILKVKQQNVECGLGHTLSYKKLSCFTFFLRPRPHTTVIYSNNNRDKNRNHSLSNYHLLSPMQTSSGRLTCTPGDPNLRSVQPE